MPFDDRRLLCADLPCRPRPDLGKVLVTGGTGYVGGCLVSELLGRGYDVRVMVRAASSEHRERWGQAEIVVADALNREELSRALEGVHTAYYLIHSLLLGPKRFEAADNQSAGNFREAADEQGVQRIIYLGGLGDVRTRLSRHLQSRMRVAEALRQGRVPVTILRAAIIIGPGSASYEIIKHLVQRLPVILVPNWVRTQCQPIAIQDVIRYLVGALEVDETVGGSFDIGGADILTYEEMMRSTASVLGRKLFFIRVPFGNIRFFSYMGSLITPVPAPITLCLMEGIANDVVCLNSDIRRLVPFPPLAYREAVIRAMSREEQDQVHTRWSDAYPPAHELAIKLHELSAPPRYTCVYSLTTDKPASALFRSVCRIGGKEGWFHANWMWRLRGMVDRVLIGVGASRGRRSISSLRVNDVIDFWRVERLKRDEMLLLRAEMKLPGLAWLEFGITPEGERNRFSVTAHFETETWFGKAYWYAFLPFHSFIFTDLIEEIEKRS